MSMFWAPLFRAVRPLRRCRPASAAFRRCLSKHADPAAPAVPVAAVVGTPPDVDGHDNGRPFAQHHNSRAAGGLHAREVFCNGDLRLDKVEVVGFDYDYTLAEYTPALQDLIYDMAKKILLDNNRYPTQLADITFDPTFAIRGLVFDRSKGLFLKLSSRQEISLGHVVYGRRTLSNTEVLDIYGGSTHLPFDYMNEHLMPIHDLFATAEACLLADVIQMAVDSDIPFVPFNLHTDVRAAISAVHQSGDMHRAVAANPDVYHSPIPYLADHLQRWRAGGKKLFLMTNSGFKFVDAGMRHLVGDAWRDLFDVVIVNANKPNWYRTRTPFRRYNDTTEFIKWGPVTKDVVANGRVLTGGSYPALLELMPRWTGDRVLYLGDQLHADLQEPARQTGWATGAIVRELAQEIAVLQSPQYRELFAEGNRLASQLDAFQAATSFDTESFPASVRRSHAGTLDKMEELKAENFYHRGALFNKQFGSMFRSDTDPSFQAFQIKRYVDVYTARLDNLLAYPVDYRFYPQRTNHMPHERRINGTMM